MSENSKHFNVFYVHTCSLEGSLNDLYVKGFSVVQVFPTGRMFKDEASKEGEEPEICAEVAIVALKVPKAHDLYTPPVEKAPKVVKKPAKAFNKKSREKLKKKKDS